jgi:pimeloyl-ACP methyl ester carboxylesterase
MVSQRYEPVPAHSNNLFDFCLSFVCERITLSLGEHVVGGDQMKHSTTIIWGLETVEDFSPACAQDDAAISRNAKMVFVKFMTVCKRMIPKSTVQRSLASAVLIALAAASLTAQGQGDTPTLKKIVVRDGVELHYEERGQGIPVVFVHGSLSDGSYWHDQLAPFAQAGFRVIAYSRRYNFPNNNEPRTGYSAIVDADDLAALIQKLHLGKVDVVGHSYGALTALFLAVRHPELVRRLVLCEAPAVSLLAHLPGDQSAIGRETLADIQARMVKPMQAAFRRGDDDAGLRVFMGYVMRDPHAWDKMSESAREETLKEVREWDVMMTTGELFPTLDPQAVRNIRAPVLLLSGEKSYPFLGLMDEELARLLPQNRRIILPGATHRMWFEQPDECRKDVLEFLRAISSHIKDEEFGWLSDSIWSVRCT